MADIRIIPALGAINVTGSADFRGDSASTVLYVSGSGNVGVGTSNPISKLHVAGAIKGTATTGHVLGTSTDTSRALSILNSGLAHGESYSIGLGYANSNNNQAEITYFLSATGSTSNRLSLGLYNSSDTLNVVGTGRVGVGITNPSTALEVIGVIRNKNSSGNANYGQFSTTEAQTTISTYSVNTGAYPADIIFSPATTERVRITTDGNVGIGITTPANRLSIGSTQDGGIDFLYDGFNNYKNQIKNYWNSGTDTRMDFNIGRTSGVAPVTIMSVGYGSNVGIGLTNPSYRLTVMNSAGATVNIGGGNSNSIPAIAIQSTSGSWASSENGFAYYYNASDGDLDLYRKNNSTTEAHVMTWQRADGNVGIGLTSPSYKLHTIGQVAVQGDEADLWLVSTGGGAGIWRILGSAGNTTKRFRVYDNDNGVDRFNINATGSIKFNAYGSGTFTGTAAYSLAVDSSGNIIETANSSLSGTGTANRVAYWTGTSTLAADADFFFDGTNVGIGTTSPAQKLHVIGVGRFDNNIQIYGDWNTTYPVVQLLDSKSGGQTWNIENGRNSNNLEFYSSGVAGTVFTVTHATGNVGIGSTAPGYKLDVNGTARANSVIIGADVTYGDPYRTVAFGNTGDGNNRILASTSTSDGMYFMAATGQGFNFRPNGGTANLVTVNSSGNVGIGSASPAQKLEVNGNIKLSSTVGSTSTPSYIWLGNDFSNGATKDKLKVYLYNAAGGEQYGFSVGSSGDVQYHSNVYHDSYVDNSRKFRISSAGAEVTGDLTVSGKITAREFHTTFVSASIIYQSGSTQFGNSSDDRHIFSGSIGLNGSDPNYPFFVSDTSTAGTRYNLAAPGMGFNLADSYAQLQLYGANGGYIDFANAAEDQDARLIYYGGDRFELTYGKNIAITGTGVGIGVTNPSYHSHIYNNSDIWHTAIGGDTGILRIGGQTNSGAVIQAFNPSTSAVRDIYLQRDGGNVGIGTTNPTATLQINGAGGDSAPSLRIISTASNIFNWASSAEYANLTTGETAIHLFGKANSANNQAYVGYRHVSDGSSGNMLTLGLYAADYLMNLTAAGNVGIGTTTPANKLQVIGGVTATSFTGSLLGDVVGNVTGNVTGTAGSETLSTVTGRGASTSTETSFNATVNAYRLILPQNTVGTTYAGVVTQPTYYIGQSNGNDDAWKIYGESGGGTNTGTLVLQSEDDYDGNESIVLRFKRTYSGYNTTDALVAKFDRVYTNVDVGIGITNPSYKLEVNGTLGVNGNATFNGTNTYINSSNIAVGNNTTDVVSIAGDTMYFPANGNVGIGTTGPIYALDMYNTGAATARVRVRGTSNYTLFQAQNSGGVLYMGIDDSGGGGFSNGAYSRIIWSSGNYPLIFAVGDTPRVRVTPGGTLLVSGSVTPGETAWKGTAVFGPDGQDKVIIGGLVSNYTGATIGGHNSALSAWGDLNIVGGNVIFRYQETEYARINTSGNVGIGSTAPTNKLQVVGGVTATSFTGSLQGNITGTAASETLSTVTGRGSVTTTPMRVEVSATGLGGYMSVGNSAEIAGNYSAYFFGNTPGDASYFKGGIAYETLASTYGRGNIHFLQNSTTSGDIVTLSDSVMTILNGGNVGIGTTSPVSRLHVSTGTPSGIGSLPSNTLLTLDNGNNNNYITIRTQADVGTYGGLLFQDNNVGGYIAFRTYDGSGANDGTNGDYMVYGTYTDHIFQAGTSESVDGKTEIMRIKSTGNVGIGTSAPESRLHIAQSNSEGKVILYIDNNASSALNNEATLKFSVDGGASVSNGGAEISTINVNAGNGNSDLTFKTYNASTGFTEKVRITNDGFVGINNTSPTTARLVVTSTGAAFSSTVTKGGNMNGIAVVATTNENTMTGIWFASGEAQNGTHWSGIAGSRSDYASNWATHLAFYTHVNATSNINDTTEKMRITGEGSVGIGTTGPTALLHVYGDADLWHTRIGGGTGELRIGGQNGSGAVIQAYTPGGSVRDLYIQRDGANVGIGTTTPYEKLDIVGNIRLGNYNTVSGTRYIGYGNNTFANQFIAGMSIESTSLGGNYSQKLNFATHHYGVFAGVRMTLDEQGNLGIGTNSPAERLDVNGSILLSETGRLAGRAYPYDTTVGAGADASTAIIEAGSTSGYRSRIALAGGNATDGNTIKFLTASSERMRITSGGNVGIGTTAPGAKLEVVGDTYLRTTVYTDTIRPYTGDQLTLLNGGNNRLYVNGNVGIGTTSPLAKLDVVTSTSYGVRVEQTIDNSGTDFNDVLFLGNSYSSDTNLASLGFATTGTDGFHHRVSLKAKRDGSVGGQLGIFLRQAGTAAHLERVTVRTDGNVGIGTTNPSYRLVVNKVSTGAPAIMIGGAFYGGPRLQTYGLDADSNAWMGLGTDMGVGNYEHSIYYSAYSGLGKLTFGTYDGTTYTTRMLLNASGNLGIGTTGPSAYLDVKGLADTAGAISLQLRSGNSANNFSSNQITLGYSNTAEYRHAIKTRHQSGSPSGNAIDFYTWLYGSATTAIGGQHVMSLDGANVGIGSTTPAYKLDVTGTIRATGDVIAYSDARVKENVVTLENSLELVQKLRGVEYNKIGETDKKIGVIAQEVLEVVPQVVQQDQDGNYSVAYGNMAGLFIEAIKQQQTYIQALEARIQKLEEQAQQKL